MAQPAPTELTLRLDLQAARVQVKRAREAADEANRILARISASLDEHTARLAELGITLEVDP